MGKYAKGRYAARGFWWVGASARAERLGRYLKKPKSGSSVFVVFGFRGSLVSSLGEALRVSLVYMSS